MAVAQPDALRSFYERRHPSYLGLINHWLFLEAAYRGGRDWFPVNIFKGEKEGVAEYARRINRAYRFNHTREVVELLQKYLFKAAITRNVDAPAVVTEFWKNTTLGGLNIDQFMRTVSVANSIGGRAAVVIDNNFVPVETKNTDGTTSTVLRPLSVAEAKALNKRIYAYVITAKDLLDYAFDEDGDGGLLWVKVRERFRDDVNPITSTGEVSERIRLWTRTDWTLFTETATGARVIDKDTRKYTNQMHITAIDRGTHDLGFVPVILADHTIGEDPYHVPGLIDDIAYLDRSVANYLSNLDAIIQDQTFSQLAIPAQSIQAGDDMYEKVLELGTKRVFVYDAGAGSTAKPEYLSPDPKQVDVILTVINKIINEIYNTVGLAGERTKEDNAVGIDNSSGVAKAYDFERVNSLLLSKAQSCDTTENKIVAMVMAWANDKTPVPEKLVSYPTTFDVMRLSDDLVIAEALAKIAAPIAVRREQMKSAVDKMFPQLAKDLKAKIVVDIDKWLEGADDLALIAPPASKFGTKPAAAPSRQGSVPAKTTAPATNK